MRLKEDIELDMVGCSETNYVLMKPDPMIVAISNRILIFSFKNTARKNLDCDFAELLFLFAEKNVEKLRKAQK